MTRARLGGGARVVMTERILMIDDDEQLSGMVGEYLGGAGMEVVARARANEGLDLLAREPFDALVLDVGLPDLDGFEVCRRVRARSEVPILMLTARGDETDRIVGLELGADDYLPKPFNPRELLARLRAILRRSAGARSAREGPGSRAALRPARDRRRGARVARIDGEAAGRSPATSSTLLCGAGRERRAACSRVTRLMQRVRGESLEAFDRSIDTHISRIRSAIEEDPQVTHAAS